MDTTERIHLLSVKTDSEIEVSSNQHQHMYQWCIWPMYLNYTTNYFNRECFVVQVLDLKQVELVYSSSFFKSIETGGNVSRALVSSCKVQGGGGGLLVWLVCCTRFTLYNIHTVLQGPRRRRRPPCLISVLYKVYSVQYTHCATTYLVPWSNVENVMIFIKKPFQISMGP